MRTVRTGLPALAAIVLVVASAAACTGGDEPSPQQRAASRFLDALGAHDAGKAAAATSAPAAAGPVVTASLAGLGRAARARFDLGATTTKGGTTTVAYRATWTLAGGSTWRYPATLPLTETKSGWTVRWSPSALQPKLTAGRHLGLSTVAAVRGGLLDAAGTPLFAATPVVTVGLEKQRVTDPAALATALAKVSELESTRAEILAALAKAQPTEFVPLITLRRPAYERIKARIYSLPGTVFRSDTRLLGHTPTYGQPLLGRVTDATAEIVAKSKGRVVAGQQTGVGGLQQALDPQLAGTSGTDVVTVSDVDGTETRLATVRAPRNGTAVRLTLDRRVQQAAEQALTGVTQQAAVVAVQPSTGKILADANTAATTYDVGLAGAFPPGSTFKIATWTAAFTAQPALTPQTKVRCPATVTVDGRRFENESRFSYPPVPVSAAFGYSCNTSAINEALRLPATALGAAARSLGLGRTWTLPVAAFSGSIPAPASQTERAADAIGQGRVLASPLLLALMAGAAQTGTVPSPSLTASARPAAAPDLPAATVAKLRPLLAATVGLPGGTAHALAGLGDVTGKTGTAEYGTATPPRSHSWFAGTRGDLAFAVFVYDGASSGTKAVPIAKKLLTALG